MADDITEFPIVTKKVSELNSTSTVEGDEILLTTQALTSKKITTQALREYILTPFLVHVSELSNLPTPIIGVITLLEDTTYLFTTEVDLLGNRLVASSGTAILGLSAENCKVLSTGLTGSPLISSTFAPPIKNISLEAETPFELDATTNPTLGLDWYGVNLINCTNPGSLKNYSNFIAHTIGILGSAGITFDGTIGTISFTDTLFNTNAGQTAIGLLAGLTVTRRIRITYSSFVTLAGETGIDLDAAATIPDEGLILDTCNFAGGGTYLNGVDSSEDIARFMENRGIDNSVSTASYYMNSNATATPIAISGTYTKILGTTSAGTIVERFNVATTNRAVYEGSLTNIFKVDVVLSFTGNNGDDIDFRIAKNGTTIASTKVRKTVDSSGVAAIVSLQHILQLVTSDYIEVFATNSKDTSPITVVDLNVIVVKV